MKLYLGQALQDGMCEIRRWLRHAVLPCKEDKLPQPEEQGPATLGMVETLLC